MSAQQGEASLNRGLGGFDFTLLVIGAVIGADIYVVSSLGASLLGPAQLIAWLAGGVLAAVIALAFVQCAAIDPEVGGSYGYARTAFGPHVAFAAGWALYVGECVALPVFPLAFVNYLDALVPGLPSAVTLLVKLALILAVSATNLLGVRQGARVNDLLTVAKLVPLALLIAVGVAFFALHHGAATAHMRPFAPFGWGHFGRALLPIFWAYAGFELAVLPAGEVRDAKRLVPLGLVVGMAIATLFYLLTSLVVVGALPWQAAAATSSPLAEAMKAMLAAFGAPSGLGLELMSIGALVSIAGVFEVFTLGVARLSYALAADGLFPRPFAKLHPRFDTPYVGLAFQAAFAFVGSTLFSLGGLIDEAVFFLGLSYLVTALAALRLVSRQPEGRLHLPGLRLLLLLAALGSVYLSTQETARQIAIGLAIVASGVALEWLRGSEWRAAQLLRAPWNAGAAELQQMEHHIHAWLLRSVARALRFAGRGSA